MRCCRCGNMRTTRSFTMRSRQRSRPFPRQFSAENLDLFLWQIMYFSLQTARICDLCCFCSVATNAKNVIVAATNCYCNHEKSAQPQFFFSCNSVVVVFTWPHPPALDLSPAFKMGPKFDPTEVRIRILWAVLLCICILHQVKYVYLRAVGGEVGATSSLAPKVT